MKILYAASVVLLGAGLGVAQCSNSQASASANSTTQSVRASFNDPAPISRMNPVTGNDPQTQLNPNAGTSFTDSPNRASLSKKNAPSQQASNPTVTTTSYGN